MIVTDRWTSKVRGPVDCTASPLSKLTGSQTKTNRDDGSYATGDLYEKHPSKPDVWRYVGRGDDVIVMVCPTVSS